MEESLEAAASRKASGRLGEFSRFPLPPPHSPRFPDLPAFAPTCRAGTGDPVDASAEGLKTTRFCMDRLEEGAGDCTLGSFGQCFIQALFSFGKYRDGSGVISIIF